ncbi:MAG TPA: STAS domain-containing protein [Candidatus Acidoferrales bacterium]|jgi:anti-sigma B factor antagonist|nr:STAS domain-containing protein [Candidatus Acidoferrales bacterium]
MEKTFHTDPVAREHTFARYLARTLSTSAAEQLENHYLGCDECFEELRATKLLIRELGGMPVDSAVERTLENVMESALESALAGDVTVIRFTGSAQLTCSSSDLSALVRMVDTRGDTKVLIDLQKVSRIDSTGLGMLMRCYTHAVRNAGVLKLLQPTPQVKRVLSLTKIDSIVPTFEDETAALLSFRDLG